MTEKLTKSNQSVEKALQIIEIMSSGKEPMRLQDIAQRCAMPASTVSRMLNALINFGYVGQNESTLRYFLTMKFTMLGNIVGSQMSLVDIVRPYLQELSMRCNESCCLAIERDMDIIYVADVDVSDNSLRLSQGVGRLAPLHCTGIGKVLLAEYTPERLNQYISARGLRAVTPHTLVSRERLMDELENIRRQGYSVDNEEHELGARSIATPIRDFTGRAIAGISIAGPVTRMSMDYIHTLTPIILDTALRISKNFAYTAK